MHMLVLDEPAVAQRLHYPDLIPAIAQALAALSSGKVVQPVRTVLPIMPHKGFFAVMPAYAGALGAKLVTFYPHNVGVHTHHAVIVMLKPETGEPLAVMDGRALTAWRTAAASALAARHLARGDAEHLLMVGAGALAPYLVRAHAAVRPIKRVTLWNRTRSRAVALAFGLSVGGIEAVVADDLENAAREADIISCATLSHEPLVRGAWLKKGAHLDLVGGFTPKMREADDQAVKRARVYVDARDGAKKAGDIIGPLKRGVIKAADIRGDLFELCRGAARGRTSETQITLFKSVGHALEDLAAAMLAWKLLRGS